MDEHKKILLQELQTITQSFCDDRLSAFLDQLSSKHALLQIQPEEANALTIASLPQTEYANFLEAFKVSIEHTFIDFQDLQYGFDIQDLGITLDALAPHGTEAVDAFIAGYVGVRPWPALSPEMLATLAAARSLNQMNLGLHLQKPGIAEFLDHHAVRVAQWMRTTN